MAAIIELDKFTYPWVNTSEYDFTIEVPEDVTAGVPITKGVNFHTEKAGDVPLKGVRFHYSTVRPSPTATVTVVAPEGPSFVNEGFWGPETGFDIPPVYNATTQFEATFSEPGVYIVILELFKVDSGEVLMSDIVEISVDAAPEPDPDPDPED